MTKYIEYKIRIASFNDTPLIFKIGDKLFTKLGMEDWTFSYVAEHLEEYPKYCIVAFIKRRF